MLYKHFYDCILFFKAVTPDKNAEIIDVGTGAGFPGMVLKIIRPDLKITLLDSLNKRLLFLNEVISQLGLQDISTVHMRAEDAGRAPAHREKYDIACARAVASLPALMEYCLPLVKKGGSFIAMKGASASEEKALSLKAAGILGAAEPTIICETLTGNEQRAFVISKKYRKPRQNTPASPPIFQKSRFNAAFFVVKRRFFPTCFSLQTEKMYLQWEAERAKEEFDVHPIR